MNLKTVRWTVFKEGKPCKRGRPLIKKVIVVLFRGEHPQRKGVRRTPPFGYVARASLPLPLRVFPSGSPFPYTIPLSVFTLSRVRWHRRIIFYASIWSKSLLILRFVFNSVLPIVRMTRRHSNLSHKPMSKIGGIR